MGEENTDISRELLESVRDAVGRKINLSLKKRVNLEVKGDKLEKRILALAAHRAYLVTARVPSKVEQSFNYLDIQNISSQKPDQLVVKHERGVLSIKLPGVEDVDEVVAHMGSRLQRICPSLAPGEVLKKCSLKPEDRMAALLAKWEDQVPVDCGPCGGFSHTYRCLCDHLGLPYRDEVQWDVDTIYLTQDTCELNLQDFIHLENRDLVVIIAALEYNQWFTKLSIKDYKLSTDLCEQILKVVSRSVRLEELVLDNASLKADFAQKLASALSHNPKSALHTLNLANNSLEDKGIAALSPPLAKQTRLKSLNLSRTSLSSKGANILAQSLSANSSLASTLTHLDLSGNALRGDDLANLCNFLGQPNNLQTLDLSNSDCPLDLICSSLLRGCLKNLSVLNMAKSVFSHRKGKDIPPSFKQFFSSAAALSTINLSGTRLVPEALKALLLGIASNTNLKEVSLDISCCELRSAGSQILEGCIAEITNISSLDISDNSFDTDLTTLLVWLAKNRSIRHLSLGKNFNNIKSKNLGQVLSNLVHMIQEDESPLTSLSLADSKLKGDLSIVLNALGSNTSLTKMDISGNGMGDMGAKMLAKALQINTKLRTVVWDKNNITPQGLQDVAAALEKNYTIRFMPMPIIDAAQALKASPDKTEDALLKMEQYLLRNHETRKYLQEQAYRLQQGIVTTTTHQMIERMCVKVQDHLNSLRYSETDPIQEDMRVAEKLMKDARNSKTLLPNMYHLRTSRNDEIGEGPCVGPIQQKLQSMAGELTSVMEEQLQGLLKSMVDTAESLCPNVMKKPNLRQELIRASAGKMAVPRGFVTATLLEQSAVDIINKISEVKLNMASFLSDRIEDEILEALSRSQQTLSEHLSRKGHGPLLHHDSQETEVLEESVLQPESHSSEAEEDLDACLLTPKSKRKSILYRMLRPISVAFEMEFDLDKALEDVPIHEVDPPAPGPPTPPPKLEKKPSALGFFGDLPSAEVPALQHITKLRPRRNKITRPSRAPAASASASAAASSSGAHVQEAEQNGAVVKVDEGMEDFFSKKITKISFKRLSQKSSQPQPQSHSQPHEGDKKRESRMSGLFNRIKPRSSKAEKTPAAPPPSATTPQHTPTTTPTHGPLTPALAPASTPQPSAPTPDPEDPLPPPPRPPPKSPIPTPTTTSQPEVTIANTPSDATDLPPPPTPTAAEEPQSPGPPKEAELPREEALPAGEAKSKLSPPMGRHIGVQVMGNDFLAEMRAKQERKAAAAANKANEHSSPEKSESPESPGSNEDDHKSPERKSPGGETQRPPEPAPRTTLPPPTSAKPTMGAPKPPTQGSKPALGPRLSGPLKTRSSSRSTDDRPDSPSGGLSPKVPTSPSTHVSSPTHMPTPAQRSKRLSSDTERESLTTSPSPEDSERRDGPSELTGDSSVFDGDQDSAAIKHASSLRSSTNPVAEDERQRIKSLPTPVKLCPEDEPLLSPGLPPPPPPLDLPDPIPEDQATEADTNA
ncbi:F-actin-uncapping protein LRRC16A-like [Engraulis encrasicolus]|uniref:F-actin-uncapping protein LRRC16A-like n=1 Tax=Engraulis encrasicolus TaxID=184585 RepID=UPI002FD14F0F